MALSYNTVQSGLISKAHTFSTASPNNKSFANIVAILSALNSERSAAAECTTHGAAVYTTNNKSLNGYNSLIAAIPTFDCACKSKVPACTCNAQNCTCNSDSVCGSRTLCTCNTECSCNRDCACDSDAGVCSCDWVCDCNEYGYPCPSDGMCPTDACTNHSCNPFVGCLCFSDEHQDITSSGCGVDCNCVAEYTCACQSFCTSNVYTCPSYVAACTCNPQVQTCPCNSKYN